MSKVIIFGLSDYAELAHFYLKHDSQHEVVAFSVNQAYMPEGKRFKDLPVLEFETIEQTYPPAEFKFFAPMSPRKRRRWPKHSNCCRHCRNSWRSSATS